MPVGFHWIVIIFEVQASQECIERTREEDRLIIDLPEAFPAKEAICYKITFGSLNTQQ